MELLENVNFGFEYGASDPIPETWKDSNDYTVTISHNGVDMDFDYFKGKLNTSEPELREVLECLVLDFFYSDGINFYEWAEELGMNTDSIRDLGIYTATLHNNTKLLNLFTRSELLELNRALIEDQN